MLITSEKVRVGMIQVDAKSLPEGATVTVLTPEGDETVELSSGSQAARSDCGG